MNILKNNKGLTVTEIIISISLVSIVLIFLLFHLQYIYYLK